MRSVFTAIQPLGEWAFLTRGTKALILHWVSLQAHVHTFCREGVILPMNSITYSLNHEGSYIYIFKKVIFGGRKSVLDMSSWLDRIISYSSFLRKPQKFPHTWRKMNSFRVPGVGLVGKGEVMLLKLCSISNFAFNLIQEGHLLHNYKRDCFHF